MKDLNRILAIALLCLIVVVGGILLYSVLHTRNIQPEGELWPNRDFKVTGKGAFFWRLEPGMLHKYTFEGRKNQPANKSSVYDPKGWYLLLNVEDDEEGIVQFFDNRIQIIQGKLLEDGVIRVRSYGDYASGPLEYWQTLLNVMFLTPKQDLKQDETREEKLSLPSLPSHRIVGNVQFTGLGQAKLGDSPIALRKYAARVSVEVQLMPKRDRITEYLAEGTVFWDPAQQLVVAGEWEYGAGLPEDRYYTPWNYAAFALEGYPFPPHDSDLATLSQNVLWSYKEDVTPTERTIQVFQKNARDQLAHMADMQEEFRKKALVDQDGDGKGEYALLTELSGAYTTLRHKDGSWPGPQPRPNLRVRESYGWVNPQGFSTVDDYCFQMWLATPDGLITDGATQAVGDPSAADLQEKPGSWCGFAWPLERDKTGRRVYFTNAAGKVWMTEDLDYSGAAKRPTPATTELPDGPTWKRVSKTDPLPRNPMILHVIRGRPFTPAVEKMVGSLQFYRFQLDQLGLAKALGEHHFRELETLRRDFDRARSDGELTEPEMNRLVSAYARLFNNIYLTTIRSALDRSEEALSKKAVPRLNEELKGLRSRLEKADAVQIKPEDILDFWKKAYDLLDRATRDETD